MNEEPSHYALNPSSDLVKRASKVAKAESPRKGEPKFHMCSFTIKAPSMPETPQKRHQYDVT